MTLFDESVTHLSAADRVLRRLIREVGPCTLTPEARRSPFESLVRAVAHQQLHGKAAQTILGRFVALYPRRKFPRPDDVLQTRDEQLRGVGFSRAKVAAIRDIAAKTLDGIVPTARQMTRLDDDEIIRRLTQVRGVEIGRAHV